jgi:hypothetical protein
VRAREKKETCGVGEDKEREGQRIRREKRRG